MFVHRCNQCHQLFQSKSSDNIIAQNLHRRGKLCTAAGIQDRALMEDIDVDGVDNIMYASNFEDADEELRSMRQIVDFERIQLDAGLRYSAIEIREAIAKMNAREECESGQQEQDIPAPEPTRMNAVDASTDIVLFQKLAMEKYTISSDDPKVFNMRYNVKWQDILSLQKFSLEANLTEALGNSLLEMISEMTVRNGLSHIPLPESWRTIPKAVGRKLKSSAVVSSLTSDDVSHRIDLFSS